MNNFTSYDIMIDDTYDMNISLSSVHMSCGWMLHFFVGHAKIDSPENDTKIMVF